VSCGLGGPPFYDNHSHPAPVEEIRDARLTISVGRQSSSPIEAPVHPSVIQMNMFWAPRLAIFVQTPPERGREFIEASGDPAFENLFTAFGLRRPRQASARRLPRPRRRDELAGAYRIKPSSAMAEYARRDGEDLTALAT